MTIEERVVQEVLEQKTFKLPKEVRDYHKQKARQKRGWKCSCCGDTTPIIKILDSKEKLCLKCNIQFCLKEGKKEPT